jgi:hypothetical protein
MRRRALLSAVAAGLAGCAGAPAGREPTEGAAGSPTATATRSPTDAGGSGDGPGGTSSATATGELPLARQGEPPTICETEPLEGGIAAIDDPAFAADWSGVEVGDLYAGGLAEGATVVGLVGEERARAYPLSVLYHHEIVNDTFPPVGGPVLVTYCSLCRSGMVAERRVAGATATFLVSGQLWVPPEVQTRAAEADNRTFAVEETDPDPGDVRNTGNLVMVDEATSSYWSQLLARAICGSQRGTTLPMVPSRTATWGDWRRDYPDTEVLLPPPRSGTVED